MSYEVDGYYLHMPHPRYAVVYEDGMSPGSVTEFDNHDDAMVQYRLAPMDSWVVVILQAPYSPEVNA